MAISPFKTFIAGEVLTAADLNSSFTTITNAGLSLVFPATASVDLDGQSLVLDSDADTSITASTDDQIDFQLSSADRFQMLLDGTVPDFRATLSDAGAAAGPYVSLVRSSATPAANDFIGRVRFRGNNSIGSETVYGYIQGQISDPTNATEDGRILFNIPVGGTDKEIVRIGGGYNVRINSEDSGATAGPTLTIHRSSSGGSAADDDFIGEIEFSGGDDLDNSTEYAKIGVQIDDTTDGTEDSHLIFSAMVGGVLTEVLSLGEGGNKVHSLAAGLSAVQASTSGNGIGFTGIRTDARRITVNFMGVSTNGTNNLRIQIGDSGGLESAGYTNVATKIDNLDNITQSAITSGFDMTVEISAADVVSGTATLTLADASTNTWIMSSAIHKITGNASLISSSGEKSLSGVLDQLTVNIIGAVDTFDAGKISILVE